VRSFGFILPRGKIFPIIPNNIFNGPIIAPDPPQLNSTPLISGQFLVRRQVLNIFRVSATELSWDQSDRALWTRQKLSCDPVFRYEPTEACLAGKKFRYKHGSHSSVHNVTRGQSFCQWTRCAEGCHNMLDSASWPLTFWPCVICTTSVPILIFPGLSVPDLGPMYATDIRQTDRRHWRQTTSSFNAPAKGTGIIKYIAYLW